MSEARLSQLRMYETTNNATAAPKHGSTQNNSNAIEMYKGLSGRMLSVYAGVCCQPGAILRPVSSPR